MNSPAHSSTLIDALPDSWIERMFDKMMLDYGKKFVDQWSGADPDKLIAHWAVEMASYTGQEIKRGLAAMAAKDWPPSLPEFKKMCRPPVDSVHAYYEAVAGLQERAKGEIGTWSHPAIFHASKGMASDLLTQSFSSVKQRWEKALADQMELGTWDAIPAAMLALAAPGKEWDKKAAGQQLKAIGASALLKPKTDHKRWAKVILKREAEGDKTLTSYQVREARLAMNEKAEA